MSFSCRKISSLEMKNAMLTNGKLLAQSVAQAFQPVQAQVKLAWPFCGHPGDVKMSDSCARLFF
jgi:hypothetical protein